MSKEVGKIKFNVRRNDIQNPCLNCGTVKKITEKGPRIKLKDTKFLRETVRLGYKETYS